MNILFFCFVSINVCTMYETETEKKARWIMEQNNICCCREEEKLLCMGTMCCLGACTTPKYSFLQPFAPTLATAGFVIIAGSWHDMIKRDEFLKKYTSIKKMH
ncbi:MAG TPA: hypothetical protein VLG50_02695 [Candidatus Saccharimonadales bacterium]|nr:hypothetical protein [Candidatus Saccharimonadales bacterium]